jgi:hypothetical protein
MAPDDTEKTRNWANTKALVSEAVGIGDHRHRAALAVAGDGNKRHVSHMRLSQAIVAANCWEESDSTANQGGPCLWLVSADLWGGMTFR